MPFKSFGSCVILALALAEVASWTIDLPEVRKYIFEKNEQEEREKKYEDYKYKKGDIPLYYSNIEGNSKHNSEHYEDVYGNTAYAREYGYESYMQKKVNGIVYHGSVYLEGLRLSLENFTRLLEDCVTVNRTTSLVQNTTSWSPPVESPLPSNSSTTSRCREATRASEHVRRLSELATWATKDLQDLAYARKYKKDEEHTLSLQENELILKLAWFLDRLAHYTGYEPKPEDFIQKENDTVNPTNTNTTAPAALVSPSPEVKRLMMECLQQNSSEAAVDRCRYPEPLPPLLQMMMEMNSNITGIPSMPVPSSNMDQVMPISRSDPVSEQSMELLVTADFKTPSSNRASPLTAVRSVQKRSVLSRDLPEVLQKNYSKVRLEKNENSTKFKQSVKIDTKNDTAINFLKYLAKHKVWEGVNSKNNDPKYFQTYEVKNQLAHKILKRAIDNKKFQHFNVPENPFQDLSRHAKHRSGVNYVEDKSIAEKVKEALAKMDGKPTSSKIVLRKLTKILRQKRYIKHEKDVDLPRESEDPQRDISYYVKNKPSRNYNSDLVQALQVRAGLEQVFNTGNIEVVRRFGANYNPLVPAPFYAGILKSQADFKK